MDQISLQLEADANAVAAEEVQKPLEKGWHEITPDSPFWPSMIDDLSNAPDLLYVNGDPEVLNTPCISIIGTRRPTPYGVSCAELAGRISAECGLTVVSGGALGCDSIAARAALKAGGKTIVIPGCGADVVYPKRSKDVFECAKAGQGCVLSIEPWGYPPMTYTFPRRNRIIAALSVALIVCEAGIPSGTFQTAEAAAEIGREILAVPGSIFSPSSRGCNKLIEDGATPICDEMGLETSISLTYGTMRLLTECEVEDNGRMLSALLASPLRVDELRAHLDLSLDRTLALITEYEINGLVCRLPDGRISATREALLLREQRRRSELN